MEQRTDINPFDPDFSLQQNMDLSFDNILADFPLNSSTPNQALPPAQPILTTPHVLEPTNEVAQPKKRGRKPGSGRKPASATIKSEPMETETEVKEKKPRKPRVAKAAPKKKAAKKLDDDSIFDSDSDEEMNDEGNTDPNNKDEKVKKLLKNREAAQQFRQRQRDHIDELEKQVQQLIQQRAQYNTQTDVLLAENKLVRNQVQYMREFLSQALAFAFSQNVSRMYPMANTNIKTVEPVQN